MVSSEIKCPAAKNHKDQIKNKPQDLFGNTSSGNRALCIAGYRPAQKFYSPHRIWHGSVTWLTNVGVHTDSVNSNERTQL